MVGRSGMGAAALAALFLAPGVFAAQVEVRERGCQRGVELVAQEAPLALVFERLASTLGFQLEVEGELSGMVTRRTTAAPGRLLADLLALQQGHVIWYARDPRCPQQPRVARVRLLAGVAAAAAAAPSPVRPAPAITSRRAPVTETATPQQLRDVEKDARRRKEDYDAHVRRHGEPPPGVEEEAARP